MISYFFSWFTLIRTFTIHAFICHNSYCKIIYGSSMVLSTHYFWCHISWSSRCILSIFWSPNSSNSEISYPYISFHIYYQIFRFNVSMNNLFFMTILQSRYETGNKKFYTQINIKIKIDLDLLVVGSSNFLYRQMWYLKSPPLSKSITR